MSKKKTNYQDSTRQIIGCFYETYNRYGYGFNKELYSNALDLSLKQHGFGIQREKRISVKYITDIIGEFKIDFVINEEILIHVTVDDELQDKETLRLYNYVKTSDYKIGLQLNFGIKPMHKRRERE